jgi:hypothetical protein
MSIGELIEGLRKQAAKLPNGLDSQVITWVRVPHAGPASVLEVNGVEQGFRKVQGGEVAVLHLDSPA